MKRFEVNYVRLLEEESNDAEFKRAWRISITDHESNCTYDNLLFTRRGKRSIPRVSNLIKEIESANGTMQLNEMQYQY